jgi:SsrA-binding protein
MKVISRNKHAYHNYQIDKEYEVGIILKWHEVKSIKTSNVNIKDSIVRLDNKELRVLNMDVPLYQKTSHNLVPWYQPKGKRKLLITKKELTKISAILDKSGNVIIPLKIFINKKGLIKLSIWVAKLMRKVEKKQILKEKDMKRQMDREIRHL